MSTAKLYQRAYIIRAKLKKNLDGSHKKNQSRLIPNFDESIQESTRAVESTLQEFLAED